MEVPNSWMVWKENPMKLDDNSGYLYDLGTPDITQLLCTHQVVAPL